MKTRQGRDFTLKANAYQLVKSVTIEEGATTERTPLNLSAMTDFVATLRHRDYPTFSRVLVATITDNIVSVEITPDEEGILGKYYMVLRGDISDLTKPDGKRRWTADFAAYEVVGATAEEDTFDEITITFTSVFGFQGLGNYELALRYGLFTGTEAEYAALVPDAVAKADNDVTTFVQNALIALNAATSEANTAAIEADRQAGIAAAAAGFADQKAREAIAAKEASDLAEAARVSAESSRVNAENARKAAETARVNEEAARVEAEQARAAAAQAQAEAEALRVTAEQARVLAENARKAAETARANAEGLRDSSEADRNEYEQARIAAEELRVSAESARVITENARKAAETARVNAETARVNAESARVNAETARVNAESARVSAEQLRVAAEQARVTAEQLREQYIAGIRAEFSYYRALNTVFSLNSNMELMANVPEGSTDEYSIDSSGQLIITY